jgi:hypothetical protein
VRVVPRLADRTVVVRPEVPFFIHRAEEVALYVSTPVWVELSVGDGRPLEEIPVFRPSDTWMGVDTTSGELCYASRTLARMEPSELVILAHRAYTEVVVRNDSPEPLFLERMSIPVRNLELYAGNDHVLWSSNVTVRQEKPGELADVRIGAGAPAACRGGMRLVEARDVVSGNVAVRAFSALFRGSSG